MSDENGIYLNDTLVAPPDGIAQTLQGNDLSKPATLQSSYTNTFQLADTLQLRELLASSEQLDSGEPYPYQTQDARIRLNGETTMDGIAELTSFSGGWELSLYEEKRNLFDRLNRSIRTADLSRYDHTRNQIGIHTRFAATDGYCYPLVDYGLLNGGTIPLEGLFPAVFLHTLVTQLLFEEGYTHVGKLPGDAIYPNLVMPFVGAEGQGNDQQWADDRKARVSLSLPDQITNQDIFGAKTFIDRIQPYDIDNLPLQGYEQGKLKPYNTTTHSYVCPDAMRVIVTASQQFQVRANSGAVEFILTVEKNGVEAGREYFSTGSFYNTLFSHPDTINLSAKVTCVKGDVLRIRLVIRRQTALGNYYCTLFNNTDASYASFVPDLTLQLGDTWRMALNLPDMTGVDLMVGIAHLYGGTWAVDKYRKQVSFVSLTDTINNTTNHVDWSDRIDTGKEPGWVPRLDPYAQSNYLKWKELDVAKKAGTDTLAYGDGLISINANTLDMEKDLFALPWAASVQSLEEVPGYGFPVKIETRAVVKGDITNSDTVARLLLVSTGPPFPTPVQVLAPDGVTITDSTVNLKPAWFGPRPTVAIYPNTNYCLCFSKVSGLKAERCLIDRHYPGLLRVLERMRVLTITMLLTPEDIATLDFGKPVRLKRVQAGSLTLSDGYYYLNRISDYQDGFVCNVVLVGY